MPRQPELRSSADAPPWLRRLGVSSWLVLGTLLVLVALAAGLAVTRAVTVPLVVVTVIAVVVMPTVDRIASWGIPRALAAAVVVVAALAIAAGTLWLVVATLVDEWPEIRVALEKGAATLDSRLDGSPAGGELVTGITDAATSALPVARDGAFTRLAQALDSAFSWTLGVLLSILVLHYALRDGREWGNWLAQRSVGESTSSTAALLTYAARTFRSYSKGRTVLALIDAAAIGIAFAIMGVAGAAAVAIVTFIGSFVPYLGGFVAGAFAVLLALAEGGIELGLVALTVVLGVQVVLENLLEPRVVGSFIKLHPVLILLATVVGALVAGLVGMIVAAPLTAIVLEAARLLRAGGALSDPPSPRGG